MLTRDSYREYAAAWRAMIDQEDYEYTDDGVKYLGTTHVVAETGFARTRELADKAARAWINYRTKPSRRYRRTFNMHATAIGYEVANAEVVS